MDPEWTKKLAMTRLQGGWVESLYKLMLFRYGALLLNVTVQSPAKDEVVSGPW